MMDQARSLRRQVLNQNPTPEPNSLPFDGLRLGLVGPRVGCGVTEICHFVAAALERRAIHCILGYCKYKAIT